MPLAPSSALSTFRNGPEDPNHDMPPAPPPAKRPPRPQGRALLYLRPGPGVPVWLLFPPAHAVRARSPSRAGIASPRLRRSRAEAGVTRQRSLPGRLVASARLPLAHPSAVVTRPRWPASVARAWAEVPIERRPRSWRHAGELAVGGRRRPQMRSALTDTAYPRAAMSRASQPGSCGCLCGPSRVVNRLAAGDGGTGRDTRPAELISCRRRADSLTKLATTARRPRCAYLQHSSTTRCRLGPHTRTATPGVMHRPSPRAGPAPRAYHGVGIAPAGFPPQWRAAC